MRFVEKEVTVLLKYSCGTRSESHEGTLVGQEVRVSKNSNLMRKGSSCLLKALSLCKINIVQVSYLQNVLIWDKE